MASRLNPKATDDGVVVYQPLDPSIVPSLDPQYVDFHNAHLAPFQPPDQLQWSPSLRTAFDPMTLGFANPVEVARAFDIQRKGYQMRVYMPAEAGSEVRAARWPCLLWFRGGGYVLGGIGSDAPFLTRVCRDAGVVAVQVAYRPAPEHPYPAAVEDGLDALQWARTVEGSRALGGIDPSCIALGGISAGGQLAAIIAMKAAEKERLQPPLRLQMLFLPVVDATASVEGGKWAGSRHSPWLTPERMMWFRRLYAPDERDWTKWDMSPNFAPTELLARSPKTWVAVASCDLLAPEAREYCELLRGVGVDVTLAEYEGGTHSLLVLAGVLELGKKLVEDAIAVLKREL